MSVTISSKVEDEMRLWKVACVLDSDLMLIGEFWEFTANRGGYPYKVFSSIEEAREFLRQ